jgi:hypothetical protein
MTPDDIGYWTIVDWQKKSERCYWRHQLSDGIREAMISNHYFGWRICSIAASLPWQLQAESAS